MSVEFRQRTPGEYARILWKRKWLIALPALAIAFAVAIVVWKLPNVYESKTLLTVRPSSISSNVVPRLSDDDLTIRINNIQQEVFSRSSLQPLIEKYGLYAAERGRGEPMDVLVERMRTRDISVRLSTSRNDITNGFDLAFRGPDPRTTQAVTAELASKYTKAQTKAAGEDARQTKEFFESKLKQAKDELDAIDQQRLQFMTQHSENLPSNSAAMIGQLTGLREQQKALITEVGRMRDQRTMLESQLGDLSKQREQEIDNIAQLVGDPKATAGYAELVKRKAELEAARQNLLTIYRAKHPDVLSVEAQLESVQREMNNMVADSERRVAERRKKLETQIDPRLNNLKYNLELVKGEIERQQKQLAQAEASIAEIDSRINGVPGTEVGLEALNREYQSKKAIYDDLVVQNQKADIIAGVQENAQGESIAVIDAANLPEQAVAPKRSLWMALGLAIGLGVGLAAAALFEVPRLLTIQTTEDAEHYTGLPVLVSLPDLRTPREEQRLRVRRTALAIASVIVTVASIPALAIILKMTHVLEFLALRG